MSQARGRTIRKFNPGVFQSDRDIIDQFVVRKRELDTVLELLRENIGAPACQHTIVVGPRGRGKTMLLARVAAELRTDPQLRRALLPVRFMEESIEVFDIGDFWLDALLYLAKECAERYPDICAEIEAGHATLVQRSPGSDIAGHAKAALLDAADRLERRLVFMVENFQSLCGEVDEDFGWQLRGSLQSDPEIVLLATATSRFEGLDDASKPFFELFRILQLAPLSTVECQKLWHEVTGDQRDTRQMRPLEIFTGGSPRLLVIVAEYARHQTMPKLLEELVGLVDDHSEYFRGNLNSLPKTERRIYAALADLWRPSSTRQVAKRARLGVRKTSALLGRLTRRGAVKVGGNGRSRLYSVAEPLHCIYYQLRRWRDQAAVVHGLIRFMVAFYGPDASAKILGSVLTDEKCHNVFLRAQEDLDPNLRELPAQCAEATCLELLERHRGLGDLDRQIRVAGSLLVMGARLGEAGEAERSIEFSDELIRRFGSSPIRDVQTLVAMAFSTKAMVRLSVGELTAAVTAFNEVVARYSRSDVPGVQECVAMALLDLGYLHRCLGEPELAIASYDDAIKRFGSSSLPRLRVFVATSLLDKGSALAALEARGFTLETLRTPDSMQSATAVWDELVERFGDDAEPDIQSQVIGAWTKKASAQMLKGKSQGAVAACEEAVRRCRRTGGPDVRGEAAMALELKAMNLIRMGCGQEALETCEILVRDFGDIAGQYGIPVRWRAMGSQIQALVLEDEEFAASRLFRKMCEDLDVANNEMVSKIVWDTIELIAIGATPGVFAEALADGAEDCELLVPLLSALRELAGSNVRVPEEFSRVALDIIRAIEARRR